MANFFEVEVDYRPSSAGLDPKLLPFIGIFGKKVKGVWTTDNLAPKYDGSNFDYSVATNIASIVHNAAGGAGVGHIGNARYAVFGKSNRGDNSERWWNDNVGTTKAILYEYDWYSSEGIGITLDVQDSDNIGIIVANYIKNDDGSMSYNVWWAIKGNHTNQNWQFHKWGGEYTIITDVGGNTSNPSDDTGDYDDTTDDIPIPDTPTIDMCDVGLVTVWKPTIAELHNLGNKLWSTDFVENIVKSFYSPMDSVVTLNIIPAIDKVATGGTANIKLGNYDTGISSTIVTSQFIEVDMGTYTVSKYWASALDYNPYTEISLFLPYIGFTKLSPDDVMGRTIHVVYKCDIITGQLNAMVAVNTDTGERVLYTQTGNFSINVPVTGANYSNVYKAAIQGSVGILTAGANIAKGGAGVASAVSSVGSAVGGVMSSKIEYQHGSSTNMSAGYLGIQKCFVIISRPNQSLAKDYNTFVGYPSNITATLGSLKGFTQVESIHLENIPATDEEKTEIEAILKEGVII